MQGAQLAAGLATMNIIVKKIIKPTKLRLSVSNNIEKIVKAMQTNESCVFKF